MERKVYCNRCRWYDGGWWELPSDDCMRITGYYSSYTSRKITKRGKEEPSELNANNDCPHYKWNWFGLRGF